MLLHHTESLIKKVWVVAGRQLGADTLLKAPQNQPEPTYRAGAREQQTYQGQVSKRVLSNQALGFADGKAHGVLLLNSNGMDVVLTKTKVRWSVTGGVLDIYFLMGPTPNLVLDQLTSIIGRPVMPPYWSLGLMNSKCVLPGPCCTVGHTLGSQGLRAAGTVTTVHYAMCLVVGCLLSIR